MRLLPVLSAVLWCCAQAVFAQETTAMAALKKSFEMPAHRALMSVMKDSTPDPFETDGCSGGMSWSWSVVADIFPGFEAAQGARPPWEDCCIVHDRAYHGANGAADEDASYAARLAADEALRLCVSLPPETDILALAERYDVPEHRIRAAYDVIANSMFNAVRFGGGPCSGLPWRWGFGYPACVAGF